MPAKPDVSTSSSGPNYARAAAGIRDWRPRERHTGSGEFAGSNAYFGSPDGLIAELRERVLGLEEALNFAADCCNTLRRKERELIVAYAYALSRSTEQAASRKRLEAEEQTAHLKAQKIDAELAYGLARMACRTQESQLTAVQTAAGMLKQQLYMDHGGNEHKPYGG